MRAERIFVPRHIGVCGSSTQLSVSAAEFCRALGRRLASHPCVVIVSGGTKQRKDTPAEDLAADWLVVDAACKVIGPDRIPDRIVTIVQQDVSRTVPFALGTPKIPRGKTSEARRISFVRSVDALIAIEGRGGTDQELAIAIEHNIPVLPVPSFSGSARQFWTAYRAEIISALRIDEQRARRWEEQPSPGDPLGVKELADDMTDVLIRSLPRRCFVIMPYSENFDHLFDQVIGPAIESAGDHPVRVDRALLTGDAVSQIDTGIKNCEYAVAVLDNLRPNVLYELGLAHGRDKPTILLNRRGALGIDGIAFDLFTRHRLEYSQVNDELRTSLKQVIDSLPSR